MKIKLNEPVVSVVGVVVTVLTVLTVGVVNGVVVAAVMVEAIGVVPEVVSGVLTVDSDAVVNDVGVIVLSVKHGIKMYYRPNSKQHYLHIRRRCNSKYSHKTCEYSQLCRLSENRIHHHHL